MHNSYATVAGDEPVAWGPRLVNSDLVVGRTAGVAGCPVEAEHYIVPGTGGHGRARADALLSVIGNFGCRVAVFGYNAKRGDTFLIMTATRPVLDALGLLLPDLAARMELAARGALGDYARRFRAAMPGKRAMLAPYFRDYLRGYGLGVAERVRELRTQVLASEGPDLASRLADDAARVDAKFRQGPQGQTILRPERTGHREARELGIAAGHEIGTGDDYLVIHDMVFAML
jgi:hypothetical protein